MRGGAGGLARSDVPFPLFIILSVPSVPQCEDSSFLLPRGTEGFSRPIPTLFTVLAMVASLVLLGLATKELPLGTAYAVWVGIGTLGTAIAGIVLFAEPVGALRVVSLFLIIAGVVGLKVSHG